MLDALSWCPPLLAAENVMRAMARGFQGKAAEEDATSLFLVLAVCGAFFLLVWGISRFLTREDKHDSFHSPRGLFVELCRKHRLAREDRRLLKQLARYHRLARPAELFLQPERFAPDSLNKALSSQAERLLALRDRLFSEVDIQRDEPLPLADVPAPSPPEAAQVDSQPSPPTKVPAPPAPLDFESPLLGDDHCPLSAY